ncbi:LysR family transcriptional regulator [Mycoavidus sp. B2-EB]|uniref:LysR family transcriptional regulator n=1 Tax=Mycoavidus sp. B2-EB TaxID=2651972 RepID=UPI00162797A6|nr:LysR family transcriptional regulator [Mycoavidus sp. B2-EB]BBO59299.1 LysR family transcriptional regulator [Mycoavidus sp. B2-EB]
MREINQRRLRYFYSVYTHGKIRTASDYLNTDCSVITRQICLLEEEIGFKLFERRPRGVAPTEVAKLLLEYYRKNCEAQAEFEAGLQALSEMRRGRIHIATASTFVAPLMGVFNQFHRQFPDVNLNIEEIFEPHKIIHQILEDILHIGIIHLCPERPDLQLYASVPLPLYMLVSKEHPLAHKQKVTLKEAMSSSLSLPASGVLRELVQSACHTEKIALPPCIFESDSTAARKKFACDSLGTVFMSVFSAREEIKKGELIALEIVHPVFQSAKLALVVRRGRPLLPATHQLLKLLHGGLSIFTQESTANDSSLIRSREEG